MSIPLLRFCFILPFNIQSAVLLSVINLVAGCLCPISSNATLSGSAAPALMNSAAISASDANETTFLIIFAMIRMEPSINLPSLLPRKKKRQLGFELQVQRDRLHRCDSVGSFHTLNIV
jgi:hypothetical protein